MSGRAVGVAAGAGFTCVAALVLYSSSMMKPGGGRYVSIAAVLIAGLASSLTTAKASNKIYLDGSIGQIIGVLIFGWIVGLVTLLLIGVVFYLAIAIAFVNSNWTF
jgi:hypothetical protein